MTIETSLCSAVLQKAIAVAAATSLGDLHWANKHWFLCLSVCLFVAQNRVDLWRVDLQMADTQSLTDWFSVRQPSILSSQSTLGYILIEFQQPAHDYTAHRLKKEDQGRWAASVGNCCYCSHHHFCCLAVFFAACSPVSLSFFQSMLVLHYNRCHCKCTCGSRSSSNSNSGTAQWWKASSTMAAEKRIE